ncbi:metallophosphoesterase [Aridibaculum aurantiacum]|uniref:metallophosphoesterase n=1 Tax=Aridibaculum aurantiacum TaxID=2810307 RepID=UPI001A96BD52|nr:metallophosphoesterase [Aridibaculum aurantiacum]
MRKWLQAWLRRPVMRWAHQHASRPVKERVHEALKELYHQLLHHPGKRGPVIDFDPASDAFIIFSDHHKGAKNGADDFAKAEPTYLAALDHYYERGYHLVALGDVEELWENLFLSVKKHNVPSFTKEGLFVHADRFTKVFGNHDLLWDNDPFAPLYLEQMYGKKLKVYEGLILQTTVNDEQLNIFLTHGHQGDSMSDGNWFSKAFIYYVWAPLQAYLGTNPNTPAYDGALKSEHNKLMYEWVANIKNILLITGHTHQPVFESLTHLERLYKHLGQAILTHDEALIAKLRGEIALRRSEGETVPDFADHKPSYFNTGCCCFEDGSITGIEIAEGSIRLIKWSCENNIHQRTVLEQMELAALVNK